MNRCTDVRIVSKSLSGLSSALDIAPEPITHTGCELAGFVDMRLRLTEFALGAGDPREIVAGEAVEAACFVEALLPFIRAGFATDAGPLGPAEHGTAAGVCYLGIAASSEIITSRSRVDLDTSAFRVRKAEVRAAYALAGEAGFSIEIGGGRRLFGIGVSLTEAVARGSVATRTCVLEHSKAAICVPFDSFAFEICNPQLSACRGKSCIAGPHEEGHRGLGIAGTTEVTIDHQTCSVTARGVTGFTDCVEQCEAFITTGLGLDQQTARKQTAIALAEVACPLVKHDRSFDGTLPLGIVSGHQTALYGPAIAGRNQWVLHALVEWLRSIGRSACDRE